MIPTPPNAASRGVLTKDLDERGTLDVLRHGVVDLGVELRLAFFKPAHGLTPELVERYRANRLTVTRQLPYDPSSGKTLDLGLFVNGIPVATAELKNPHHRPERRARHHPVPPRPGPEERHPRSSGPRPFRGGPRAGLHDDPARGRGDAVPAVQPRARPAQGQPPEPARAPHVLPVGAGLAAGQLAGPAGPVHPRRAPGEGDRRPEARRERSSSPATTSGMPSWPSKPMLGNTAPGSSYLIQHSAGSGKSNTIAWTAHRLVQPARRGMTRRSSTR